MKRNHHNTIMVNYVCFMFVSFLAVSCVHADDDDVLSCLELFKPENMNKSCCQSLKLLADEVDRCKQKDEEFTCEVSKCMLDKYGILQEGSDDIDEASAKELLDALEEEYPDQKNMITRVKNQCLNEKYKRMPPKKTCPAIKFQICSYVHSIVECDSWKSDDDCKKMSDHAMKCKRALD